MDVKNIGSMVLCLVNPKSSVIIPISESIKAFWASLTPKKRLPRVVISAEIASYLLIYSINGVLLYAEKRDRELIL